ncbi:peptide chain release factor N(5)-glutamine methyltransferase [Vagococcus vulneris]|uniref:Release factor glutamine methyltransferase n=1 Tax=Vagococcus vulneris TaxID=1977869 RepID=A0A429ZWN7_9ENTE|nr:peptide chain release factor N(5)-glutamine methyltransferase [Vagococcus vulneris]RST98213.1 protein-(glutamine-N5) methyltransferase, release factor-specific [Vagococcus vulneris]
MDSVQTYVEVLKWASSFLKENGKDAFLAEYLLLERLGWNKTQLLVSFKKIMKPVELKQFREDIAQVVSGIPAQYVIGSTEFYGNRFKVTTDTLIPRPETEELVELCLQENKAPVLNVVDIGTGTGVIGLSLKLNRPDWHVTLIDISKAALSVAADNAKKLALDVDLIESNVLTQYKGSKLDIIISNPPYISYFEEAVMDESVKEYEPNTALFAEDNGLAVYKDIAKEAQYHLKPKGKIYLEIGYLQGNAVKKIFQQAFPEKQVDVIKDLNKHDRLVRVG